MKYMLLGEENKMKIVLKIVSIILVLSFILGNISYAFNNTLQITSKDLETKEIITKKIETNEKRRSRVSLSTEPYIPNEVIMPFKVQGEDEREKITWTDKFPYRAISYIESYWPDNSITQGTAFIFNKNVALTAGHCVYDKERGGWAKGITIWPGKRGEYNPFGTAKATRLHTATGYIENGIFALDWGVIELDKEIGNTTGWFGLTYKEGSVAGEFVSIAGYPASDTYFQYKASGTIESCSDDFMAYQIDTSGGQSGSPIYMNNTQVIGIHTRGQGDANFGPRITRTLFDFCKSFIH